MKTSQNITDEEERKILELIEIFKKRVKKWDDYEDERFRRFLEIQDPVFRAKLLACMKENIQETNLIDSFFVRYKNEHIPLKKSQTQDYSRMSRTLKEKTREARNKIWSRFIESNYDAPQPRSPKEETKQTIMHSEEEDLQPNKEKALKPKKPRLKESKTVKIEKI